MFFFSLYLSSLEVSSKVQFGLRQWINGMKEKEINLIFLFVFQIEILNAKIFRIILQIDIYGSFYFSIGSRSFGGRASIETEPAIEQWALDLEFMVSYVFEEWHYDFINIK